ncbi:MAG: hypothetical protein KOO60_07235 [Gemmatimonadales bacterium]|nr:hypothetical protein [Gemmatimonadales bacterium]
MGDHFAACDQRIKYEGDIIQRRIMRANEVVRVQSAPIMDESRIRIQSEISTAKEYPRNLAEAEKAMQSYALTPERAPSMYYSIPRGQTMIEGPTVRLAEIAVTAFKNLAVETILPDVPFTATHAVATAMCRDLENNVAVKETVIRKITDKNGRRFNEDMVTITQRAAASIAYRTVVLRVIPHWIIDPIWEKAKQIAAGNAEHLPTTRAKALKEFAKLGIDEPRVLAMLGVPTVDEITLANIATLKGAYNSLKEGHATAETIFPPVKSESPTPDTFDPEEIKDVTPPAGPRPTSNLLG